METIKIYRRTPSNPGAPTSSLSPLLLAENDNAIEFIVVYLSPEIQHVTSGHSPLDDLDDFVLFEQTDLTRFKTESNNPINPFADAHSSNLKITDTA